MITALVVLASSMVLLALVGALVNHSKVGRLLEAPSGAVRIERIRAFNVKNTVDLYARHGWEVVEQAPTAASAINPQVTITFRKS